jgi:CHAT domain-containing protein
VGPCQDLGSIVHHLAAGGGWLGAGQETDVVRIDRGIAEFRKALAGAPPGHAQRCSCLFSLALALNRRSEVTGRVDTLVEAAALLDEAASAAGGPQHPQWQPVHDLLAAIRQRTGNYAGVSDAVGNAQRGSLWRAVLEADPGGAHDPVEEAAQEARQRARQAVGVGDVAGALQALDAGRGLMLFAATQTHRIPTLLDAAGRPDLASQWTSAQKSRPASLRQQVLDTLASHAPASMFDPPSLAQVQAALTRLDVDAVAYLVPAAPPHDGMALIAPAVGPPAYLVLPQLEVPEGGEVDLYVSALTRRHVTGQRDGAAVNPSGFADRVDALCDWAWRAAIGPLLESYLPRLPALPDHRVPRIVLIPMGDLARVPWHAARRRDGTYAVQLAGISHAVSARLLCENAALDPVPLGSTGLVVGDPDVGARAVPLPAARFEAYAVRRAFYRGARYLGRLPDGRQSPSGAGTVDEVRAWLTSARPSAGAMLHLACHGWHATGGDAAARLLLADRGPAYGGPADGGPAYGGPADGGPADGGPDRDDAVDDLEAEELVDLLVLADRAIALVVLAACNSGRSAYGYDEAYSLGTGFLAGRTRSVLATQWSVPDRATSSLMYLFHRHLRQGGLPPWQALRQAQLWMLDPNRVAPDGIPPELVPGPDVAPEHVVSWAGFVHYGQ